ncbi:MAG: YigZ family protein [Lachnospirales bacterium]
MIKKYVTVKGVGEAEIVEKKSRFISHITPVSSEKEAIEFIEAIKKKYWDARHNCSAFQIGENNQIQRYNDDGEPGGTAGMPMLDVLRGRDIKNTLVVVTRYFGGTLLGTGGLVRAYSKSATEGLKAAGLIERVLHNEVRITCDYTLSGKVQYEAMNNGHIIKDTVYTDKVEFIILCSYDKTDGFKKNIINVTGNKAVITDGEDIYVDREIEF